MRKSTRAAWLLAAALLTNLCPAWADNPGAIGLQAAENSLKRFTVADGLEVSLFACEPQVVNPTDMDIDERGRVWIAEGANYRSSFQRWGVLRPGGDRIVTLERMKDGTVKETVFYQDPSVNSALGICVLGNKVIVSDSPNVFVLTDTDGDGQADTRDLLFTGIGGKDHDHGIHAFSFGPDGKLYFNMGNEGRELHAPVTARVALHGPIEDAPMKPVVDLEGNEVKAQGKPYRMGMVFRCNLDGSAVETLAWNFRNNYEVAVDSFGTLWQSDNDDDGNRGVRINYVMEHGNFGYCDEMTGEGWSTGWEKARAKGAPEDTRIFYEWHQYDPGVVPDLLHTGAGAPTGILVYEGNLLPEVFRNQMIHCDAGTRVVRSYPVQAQGAGYQARTEDLLKTSDEWFRPSDACVGPDGSLYVADWNDAGVGGHYMADQKLETMTGRVYRVAPRGHPASVPPLDLGTAAGCVQALQSPNLSTRYLAWTRLNAMQGQAESSLAGLWSSGDPRMRARALHLLARFKGSENRYVLEALKDSDPDLRITGLRIARERQLDLIPLVKLLSHDLSSAVRRECALVLRHQASPEARQLWAQLALQFDVSDRWYLEALGIGADRQWDACLDAWRAAAGQQWNSAAGREIVWRSRSTNTPALLVAILNDKSLSAADCDHFLHAFDFIAGPEREAALLELVTVPREANRDALTIEALHRLKGINLETHPGVKLVLAKLLGEMQGTAQFVAMVGEFQIKGQAAGLLEIAEQDPGIPAGVDAMRLLLKQQDLDLLTQSLGGTNALHVAQVLGSTGEREIVPLLAPLVQDSARDLALRKQVVRSLARVQEGAAALLELAKAQKLPDDLKLVASSELNSLRWDNLRAQAVQLLPMPASLNAQPLPPISELVKKKGDPVAGSAVFQRETVACFKCHQINGAGTDFGPNLSRNRSQTRQRGHL